MHAVLHATPARDLHRCGEYYHKSCSSEVLTVPRMMRSTTTRSWTNSALPILLVSTSVLAVLTNILVTYHNVAQLRQLLPPEHSRNYSKPPACSHIPLNNTGYEGWTVADHPNELPVDVPQVSIVWDHLPPRFDMHNDTEWGTLLPTDGSIRMEPEGGVFLVSMVHQLHCLDIIRVGYLTDRTRWQEHVQHCLRYLLQAVMCFADPTLEIDEKVMVDGEWTHKIHDSGIAHKCRDPSAMQEFMLAHRVPPEYFDPST